MNRTLVFLPDINDVRVLIIFIRDTAIMKILNSTRSFYSFNVLILILLNIEALYFSNRLFFVHTYFKFC